MYEKFQQHLQHQLNEIESTGLFKNERILYAAAYDANGGVISMDGNMPPLDKIKTLSDKYDAMIMVDESHSDGVIGKTGRGTTEEFNLRGQVEIITGTLGKARIRVQLSAAHTHDQLKKVVAAFEKVGRDLNIVLLA